MQDNNNKDNKQQPRRRNPLLDLFFVIIFIVFIVGAILFITNLVKRDPTVLDFKTFSDYLNNGNITEEIVATPIGGDNLDLFNLTGLAAIIASK